MLSLLIAAASFLPFNDGWEFRREGEQEWQRVSLPHDAARDLGYDERENPDHGYKPSPNATYRKEFATPQGTGSLALRFDGVYADSTVRVNGRRVGGRRNGYLPFEAPLDIALPTNVVEVACNAAAPNARWYAGVGILRDVWLVRRNGFSFGPERVALTTELAWNGTAIVRVKVDGAKVVAPKGGVLKIPNPRLWTPETPNLYTISVTAKNLRDECSTVELRYGIRTVEFTKDRGMLLNGKPYRIKGVCRHDTYGALGAAFNEAAARRELAMMKEMGANAIRTAHNPHSPRFYDLCDEMGFLVMDEAFDEWRIPKTRNGYSRFFDACWERDLADFVRRDRNHPCVVIWSVGNETHDQRGGAEGGVLTRKMVDLVHALDPTRPVTSGLNVPAAAYTNGVIDALDVVGLNYNAKWYAKLKGKKPLVGSETAPSLAERDTYLFDERDGKMVPVQARGHNECAYSPRAFSWAAPAETSLKVQRDSPWSAGEFTWCTFDYMGEPEHTDRKTHAYWPARSSYWGLCDLAGMPKDRYYLYRSQWSDKPTVHLMPDWTHPGCEGKVFPVWCYTNAKEAELFLNGKSLGVRRFADTDDLHLSWDVAYEPGCLEVRAKMADGTVATDCRRTAGPVAALRESVLFEHGGIVFLRYDAVDANGVRVISCDAPVEISVVGGEMLGADNGSTTDHTPFSSPRRSLYRGSIVVIARKTSDAFRVSAAFAASERDAGLHGRAMPLERIWAENARGDESAREWRAVAWRNERVHGAFAIWGTGTNLDIRAEADALVGPAGVKIPVRVRWVRETLASRFPHGKGPWDPVKYPLFPVGDILDDAQPFALNDRGFRGLWVSLKTPSDAPPGRYAGTLRVRRGGTTLAFPLALDLLDATLPAKKRMYLDIWQTPWTIARYYGVKPFSPEHYARLEPIYRELADAGQRAITVTITDYPWNIRENIDTPRSMVRYVKRRDGTFVADFSLLDSYVAFARACGLGPQIHCYALVKFQQHDDYWYDDETAGKPACIRCKPGSAAFEAYWTPLLRQLERHATDMGWGGNVYIALDELPRAETVAAAKLVAKCAPSLKFQMAGNRNPSHFEGIVINSYSQGMHKPTYFTPEFFDEIAARRAKGFVTTIYVCCSPPRPNCLALSPLVEQRWLGLFMAAKGFDGFLKSTSHRWTPAVDPLVDTSCLPYFPCGDSFLLYPGPRSSVRWESLRDGFEDFEKIAELRATGRMTPELETALSKIDYGRFYGSDEQTVRREVAAALAAIDSAAQRH